MFAIRPLALFFVRKEDRGQIYFCIISFTSQNGYDPFYFTYNPSLFPFKVTLINNSIGGSNSPSESLLT